MMRTALPAIALFAAIPVQAQAQARGQGPMSSVGTIGQRQSRERAGESVVATGRIAGRIQSRIQARIRNRIDRDYAPPGDTTSAVAAAQNEARTVTPPKP